MSPEIVDAAVRVAKERGRGVADVPLTAIAAAGGISRSTLLRRIGGRRRALDEAVQAAGYDPGGRPPVRERAVEAAAHLISRHGLAALTLDAVAYEADCSSPSLHAAFEGRDGLLSAVFERYSPLPDLERLMADRPEGLEETVRGVYRALIAAVGREPRVMPALIADVFGNPSGPARPVWEHMLFPRMLGSLGAWLREESEVGRLRPLPLLGQQLIGPLAMHMLTRPVLAHVWRADFPSVEEACDAFAKAFLRAAAVPAAAAPGGADIDDTSPAGDNE